MGKFYQFGRDDTVEIVRRMLRFSFLMYYMISLSFRFCFQDLEDVFTGLTAASVFDYIVDLFFMVDTIYLVRSNAVAPFGHIPFQPLGSSAQKNFSDAGKDDVDPSIGNRAASTFARKMEIAFQVFLLFPFELVVFIAGYDRYGWLRITKALRAYYFYTYWNQLAELMEVYKIITNVGTERVLFFLVVMVVVGHVSACLFYAVALGVMRSGNSNTWLKDDGLVDLNDEGDVVFLQKTRYRYIRALHWSIQTLESIGFGDITPISESETWYVIFYFYVGAFLVYFSLTSIVMFISNMDSHRTANLIKLARFDKYASYRKLPPDLTRRIKSFYAYQWQILGGVDEQEILSELPANLNEQVSQTVLRNQLMKVAAFKELNKALLNALTENVESYIFSPADIIVAADSRVKGIYILSSGKIEVTNLFLGTAPTILVPGDVFGEKAMYSSFTSPFDVRANSFAEVLYLAGTIYRNTCRLHMEKEECEELLSKYQLATNTAVGAGAISVGDPEKQSRMSIYTTAKVSAAPALARDGSEPRERGITRGESNEMALGEFTQSYQDMPAWKKTFRTFTWAGFFSPVSMFRVLWDSIILVGIIFYYVVNALLLSACVRQDYFDHYRALLIASYVVDSIFLLDLLLRAWLFGYVVHGVSYTQPMQIFNHFLQENNVGLTLLAVLPLEVLVGLAAGWRIIPVMRLLKLLHGRNIQHYVQNFSDLLRINFRISFSWEIGRFITLYFLLFLLVHWAGCILQLVGDVSVSVMDYPTNWRREDLASDIIDVNYAAFGGAMYYLRSVYWAISTMSSIGVGDITVSNPMETIVMLFIVFFGYLAFNTLLGSIASLISNFNTQKREFTTKVNKITQLAKYKNIPLDIDAKILRYFEYVWSRYSGVNEAEVLSSMPKSLRSLVKNHVMGPFISRIPFFADCSDPMQQMIVSLLEPRVFLHDECVIKIDEIGKEMFILERGVVLIQSKDREITFTSLRKGDYFGESSLLAVAKRTASVYATGYVDTYYLTRENFIKVAEIFPSEYHGVLSSIKSILEEKTNFNRRMTVIKTIASMSAVSAASTSSAVTALAAVSPMGMDGSSNGGGGSGGGEVSAVSSSSAPTVIGTDGTIINNSNMENIGIGTTFGAAGTVGTSSEGDREERDSSEGDAEEEDDGEGEVYDGRIRVRHENSVSVAEGAGALGNRLHERKLVKHHKKEEKHLQKYIHPDSNFKLVWEVVIFFSIIYSLLMIPLRIALEISPLVFIVDYVVDVLHLVDNYLNYRVFAIFSGGELLTSVEDIQRSYAGSRLVLDVIVAIPYDFIALGFLDYPLKTTLFVLALTRLPKMLKLIEASQSYQQVEKLAEKMHFPFLLVRFLQVTLGLLLISHWASCAIYLLALSHNEGSCVAEPGAIYGTDCQWKSTFVQQQIALLKLPLDGGTQWERFLRAMNWCTPMLASATMGDVYAVNSNESLFILAMMFCVLAVYGAIIGSVISLVSDASEETTSMYREIEVIRKYLISNRIPSSLIDSSIALLRYLASEEGSLSYQQDDLFGELPHSIQSSIDMHLKTLPFLRVCPIFDFANDELLKGISAKLVRKLYSMGDQIITCGDLGHEMFFLETGTVDVISEDGILFASLEEGSFFGETAVFFRSPRAATIRASSPYVACLVLSKEDLDQEFRQCNFDVEEVLEAFRSLQQTNQQRNAAVALNLERAKDPHFKLHHLLGIDRDTTSVSFLQWVRHTLSPDSYYRICWDAIGTMLLIYYIFSIPFYISFLFGEKLDLYFRFIALDFLFDFYFVLDIICKAFFFSFNLDLVNAKLETDGEAIFRNYRDNGWFYLDVLASVPLEFLSLIPGVPMARFFLFRINHLLRMAELMPYLALMEHHFTEKTHVYISRAGSMLLKATIAYVIINHFMSCVYFMIHRYAERHTPLTYLVADGQATYDPVTGEHDICSANISMCYARSIYFVLGIMASVGYGDISPYTNREIVWQQVVAIMGAYNSAIFVGFCGTFLEDIDMTGDSAFKKKVRYIEKYIQYRKLDPKLKDAILAQYTHAWQKERSLNGQNNEILSKLSDPSIMEICLQLHSDILLKTPLLRDTAYPVRRRIAAVLRPQIALSDGYLYRAGDVGRCLFFVSSGRIQITPSRERSSLDSFGLQSMRLLLHKQSVHGKIYLPGDHFGEYCLISKSGLRPDTAFVETASEVYALNKSDIWEFFRYMTYTDRRIFILELFSRVGDRYHIKHDLHEIDCEDFESERNDSRIKFLYRLAYRAMSELIEHIEITEETPAFDDPNYEIIQILREESNKLLTMSLSDKFEHGAVDPMDVLDSSHGKRAKALRRFSAASMQNRLKLDQLSTEEDYTDEGLLTSKSRKGSVGSSSFFQESQSGKMSRAMDEARSRVMSDDSGGLDYFRRTSSVAGDFASATEGGGGGREGESEDERGGGVGRGGTRRGDAKCGEDGDEGGNSSSGSDDDSDDQEGKEDRGPLEIRVANVSSSGGTPRVGRLPSVDNAQQQTLQQPHRHHPHHQHSDSAVSSIGDASVGSSQHNTGESGSSRPPYGRLSPKSLGSSQNPLPTFSFSPRNINPGSLSPKAIEALRATAVSGAGARDRLSMRGGRRHSDNSLPKMVVTMSEKSATTGGSQSAVVSQAEAVDPLTPTARDHGGSSPFSSSPKKTAKRRSSLSSIPDLPNH